MCSPGSPCRRTSSPGQGCVRVLPVTLSPSEAIAPSAPRCLADRHSRTSYFSARTFPQVLHAGPALHASASANRPTPIVRSSLAWDTAQPQHPDHIYRVIHTYIRCLYRRRLMCLMCLKPPRPRHQHSTLPSRCASKWMPEAKDWPHEQCAGCICGTATGACLPSSGGAACAICASEDDDTL